MPRVHAKLLDMRSLHELFKYNWWPQCFVELRDPAIQQFQPFSNEQP